ncbi:hypothetical protein AWB67_06693 [Caballeronia terrestris]|uniref:Uncharacterized protein n=1 Tax=Caballeronia terrestris TaxID=1226301 RepID=A0A158KVP5_9BURK|nr:hypothetical protein AWB67_06693 [Caballeronia terrestris]
MYEKSEGGHLTRVSDFPPVQSQQTIWPTERSFTFTLLITVFSA